MCVKSGTRQETMTSVGIDLGTSTTQLIFSEIVVANKAGSYMVPRVDIIDKKVIYRSPIYFTPLLSPTEIDTEAVKRIVTNEYKAAGITPDMVDSGAVIITGETARKQNANLVLKALSESAGEFVVATAGPDLESVLSAKGAGTDTFSEERRCVMANLDIGGGTTNIAVFQKGTILGVTCLDIGGRLIKIDENKKITYIYSKTQALAERHGISIKVGDIADIDKISRLCEIMVEICAESIGLASATGELNGFYTNDGKGLPQIPPINAITLSGGVASVFYDEENLYSNDVFKYGDIGVLLARAFKNSKSFRQIEIVRPTETIGATVVGAGIHTTEISGSTISYADGVLPIKNLPILNVGDENESDTSKIAASIKNQLSLYKTDGKLDQLAISFKGYGYTTFNELQALADAIIDGAKEIIESSRPLIIVVEADIAKALGHCINFKLTNKKSVICIDGIRTLTGDYIDIGEPVCGGHVLPVVIKTLIFNS